MRFLTSFLPGESGLRLPARFGNLALRLPSEFYLILLVLAILLVFLIGVTCLIRMFERGFSFSSGVSAPLPKKKLTPTQKFILAASSPTRANFRKCVIDIWGTRESEEEVKKVIELFEWGWGEFTYENAKEAAYDCIERGYNEKYREYCSLGASSPEIASKYSRLQRGLFRKMQQQYPEQGMLAWDLVRALSVVGGAYMGGAMEYREAAEIALAACRLLQKNFSSWDDMVNNYTLGYQFWRNRKMKDRLNYYKNLKQTWIYDISWDAVLREEEL